MRSVSKGKSAVSEPTASAAEAVSAAPEAPSAVLLGVLTEKVVGSMVLVVVVLGLIQTVNVLAAIVGRALLRVRKHLADTPPRESWNMQQEELQTSLASLSCLNFLSASARLTGSPITSWVCLSG